MITTGLTTQAKLLMLQLLAKESFKVALYDMDANLDPSTPAYTSIGEVQGKGYKPGGVPLKNARVFEANGCAYLGWDSVVLPVASIRASGFLIYATSSSNRAIFVGAWNQSYESVEGPFTINISADQIGLE